MFEPDNLLPDRALQKASDFNVQEFLERLDSPLLLLKTQPQDGSPSVPIVQQLEKTAWKYRMDVRVLLAKLQVEQSLVTRPPTPERLEWAFGFGLTDSDRMGAYRGFSRQLESAAQALTGYLDSRHPLTVVGQVGKPMKVLDGTPLSPKTLATAALYRYTPYVGNRPHGTLVPPFGNYLFYLVWTQFFGTEPQADGSAPDAWKLIVPPDNWRHPLDLPAECLPTAREVARRLGLVAHEDASRLKLYLGLPRSAPAVPAGKEPDAEQVVFPSGERFSVLEDGDPRYRPGLTARAAPLVRARPEARVSEHFTMGEFMPRDPAYDCIRLSPDLVELCEAIRRELGGHPLLVNSGYRPPAYNQMVGGVSGSLHLDGLAADLSSLHVPFDRLVRVADRVVGDRGGVGTYWNQQFVHVDLRGERSRWP
ncbi:MAG: D-Ala-D-Ala carboxypeptidase family metallohydrolase [Candidatus Eremiobacterota bacterium]